MVRIKCGKNVKYKDIEKMYSSLLKVSKVGCSIEILPNQDNYLEEDQIIVEIGQIYHCKYSEDISDIVEPSLLKKFTELIYKLKLEEF